MSVCARAEERRSGPRTTRRRRCSGPLARLNGREQHPARGRYLGKRACRARGGVGVGWRRGRRAACDLRLWNPGLGQEDPAGSLRQVKLRWRAHTRAGARTLEDCTVDLAEDSEAETCPACGHLRASAVSAKVWGRRYLPQQQPLAHSALCCLLRPNHRLPFSEAPQGLSSPGASCQPEASAEVSVLPPRCLCVLRVVPHLVSPSTRPRNGDTVSERRQAGGLCTDRAARVLVCLAGPGGSKEDAAGAALPPTVPRPPPPPRGRRPGARQLPRAICVPRPSAALLRLRWDRGRPGPRGPSPQGCAGLETRPWPGRNPPASPGDARGISRSAPVGRQSGGGGSSTGHLDPQDEPWPRPRGPRCRARAVVWPEGQAQRAPPHQVSPSRAMRALAPAPRPASSALRGLVVSRRSPGGPRGDVTSEVSPAAPVAAPRPGPGRSRIPPPPRPPRPPSATGSACLPGWAPQGVAMPGPRPGPRLS